MKIEDMQFHRLFSKTMHKNLKLPLGEMTFTKDFVKDGRGDLYPVVFKSADCVEAVENNSYHLALGSVERWIGGFFPYATYEVTFCAQNGCCGFSFYLPTGKATIKYEKGTLAFSEGKKEEAVDFYTDKDMTLIVSCRPNAFDIYYMQRGKPTYFCTFKSQVFANSNLQKNFQSGYVTVTAKGNVTVTDAAYYIDCGISQADIRPIRYENGDVMLENGKVFFSLSVRMQEEMFQGIVSWIPSTSKFELTGALFYDSGDGKWCGDVAASILFNRKTSQWYLWVCSFAHGHILGHAEFKGDIRFGVNVVDITLMDKADADADSTEFLGFANDEDPDFYYNEQENKWYMAICRSDPTTQSYKYYFFKSNNPFDSYSYIGKGYDGAETGGSFVTVENEKAFICGNAFDKRANYRIYTKDGMSEAKFDFDDGGFRGWGTVVPIEMGSRKRYFWLTFDRQGGSNYNWSYGNIYCFEAEL